MTDSAAGHAFISYVREDRKAVERIALALRVAGVPVWTDKDALEPGQDWKITIRQAVQHNALAFIAVFSQNSERRSSSYQNEELLLAVEQFRQRAPGKVWLIPVRLDECSTPEFDLGAGRTLGSLQRVDLFGDDQSNEMIRLVTAVVRVLETKPAEPALARAIVSEFPDDERGPQVAHAVKSMILDPTRRIELEDLLSGEASRAKRSLDDDGKFPTALPTVANEVELVRWLADRSMSYLSVMRPLVHAIVAGAAYAEATNLALWARTVRTIASRVDKPKSGVIVLLALDHYPLTVLVYAGSLAAVARKNYASLRAIAVDAFVRDEGRKVPVANAVQSHRFSDILGLAANVLAFLSEGKEVNDEMIESWRVRGGTRYTPMSDHLHAALREALMPLVTDPGDYDDIFDETEVMLGLIATDVALQARSRNEYVSPGGTGRFTWRYRHVPVPIHRVLEAALLSDGSDWPPLAAGLFGGSEARARAAFSEYGELSDRTIANRW